ncbi:MAG: hypothetical protein MZU91_14895 [Desulfosudis oleivorans]|nr:hypothetical protein [Desulfosudis oleivorans]
MPIERNHVEQQQSGRRGRQSRCRARARRENKEWRRSPALLIVHQGALGDLVCIFPAHRGAAAPFHPRLGILCQEPPRKTGRGRGSWSTPGFRSRPPGRPPLRAARPDRRRPAPACPLRAHAWSSPVEAPGVLPAAHRRRPRLPRPAAAAGGPAHARGRARTGAHPAAAAFCRTRSARFRNGPRPQPLPRRKSRSKTVLIHPGAGSPRKRWPLSGFRDVAVQLAALRLSPEFVIGPAEQDLLPELARRDATVHRPDDSLDLLALLRSAAAYIGNDSGVSHLAAWAGLPSVVIFGPTDPVRWRPRGCSVEIVQPPLDCTALLRNCS